MKGFVSIPRATRLLVLLAIAVLCLWGKTAQAQPLGKGNGNVPSVVLILPEPTDDTTFRAADAVSAQLADLPVNFVAEQVEGWADDLPSRVDQARTIATDHGALTAFWLDLYTDNQVFLFIASSDGGRMLVRNIQYAGEGTEAYLETIAIIVRSAVKAILAGGTIGVSAPPPPEPDTQPLPQKEPPRERFMVSAAYAMQLYSDELPVIHGARLDAWVRLVAGLHIFVAYRLQFPGSVSSENLNVYIRPHPIELGLGGRWRPGGWRVATGAAMVLDVVTFDSASSSEQVDAITPDAKLGVLVSPVFEIGRMVGKVADVFVAIHLDIPLKNQKYVLKFGNDNIEITSPWAVRPMFQLGMKFTLL